MAHYFTREEAEALLPEITVVLYKIQESHRNVLALKTELEEIQAQAMGNGHHLYERILRLQQDVAASMQQLRDALEELEPFGCELKDPAIGLIDFLSLRDGEEVYLCWKLGEQSVAFWHYLHTGFAGRQPLD
ncbi:hypothetical protein KSF_020970 [Reticulibacter mediterranei]|uniref:DUF2203 domain-containing protein n=2 Tax=Reticulibacter mediterranei TaxID=2778369 RepID=A0A8J3MYH3_9CHLR|nr:hypothetical protein KSF_020970 [Reticulibacter mediterranei]